jgi:hypothetical protein
MSFPSSKVHRVSRRKLGRGQATVAPGVPITVTGAGSTATLTAARPVVVTGQPNLTVATRTIVSYAVVSPTVITVLMSGALTGLAYSLPSPQPKIATYQGGPVLGTTGTFP